MRTLRGGISGGGDNQGKGPEAGRGHGGFPEENKRPMRLYSLVSKLGHLGEWPECSMRLFEKWARVSLTERHVEFGS